MFVDYQEQPQEMFVPLGTVNLEGTDLTNLKVLNDSFHNQAALLGLSLKDFGEEYKIEIETISGYDYLVFSVSQKYYEFLIEKEQQMSSNIFMANPGLLTLQ